MEEKTVWESDFFGVATHITDIYFGDDDKFENEHMPRFEEITKRFTKIYGAKPSYFARAPGKVNLMGDYLIQNGYSVVRTCLEQDTILAFSLSDEPYIEINHILPTLYPPEKLSNDPTQKFKEDSHYINCILAGYKAALSDQNLDKLKGLKVLVTSNLSIDAGLGSSTSLIICSSLMTLFANNLLYKVRKGRLLESVLKYEKMIAEVEIENLDHILISSSKRGSALYMAPNEKPISIKIPSSLAFVVANSLTPTAKILTQGTHNNKRIVECRLAVCLLARELQISDKVSLKTFKELQNLLAYSLEDMLNLVELHLKKDSYKTKELEEMIGSPLIKCLTDIPYADLVVNSNHEFFLRQ
jgi:Galactokinase